MNGWWTTLLLILGGIGHIVFWTAAVNRVHGLGLRRLLIDALTLLCAAAMALIPLPILWDYWVAPRGELATYSINYLVIASLILFGSIAQKWSWRTAATNRRALISNTTRVVDLSDRGKELLAPGYPRIVGSLPGNEVLRISVEKKTLAVRNLPPELEGFRIAHLSDLHMSGRIGQDYYRELVRITNDAQVDLIALTGDLVEHDMCLPWVKEVLAGLQATLDVYFILGNHDQKTDITRLRQELVDVGYVDLGGRTTTIAVGTAEILLAGNEQPWMPPSPEVPPRYEATEFRLLLSHTPDQFHWARQWDFDLMLAGHNHGGQICFPLLGAIVAPSVLGTRYASGVFEEEGTVLHVSRGSGSLAPLRWNCPPEVAILTLTAEAS